MKRKQESSQKESPNKQDYLESMFLDEEALRLEHLRAMAMAEEKMRQQKEQRLAEFEMTNDYWNDDNMIGYNEEAKWGTRKALAKRQQHQGGHGAGRMSSGGMGKLRQSDSILVNRLTGKSSSGGSGRSLSGELKGHSRRKPTQQQQQLKGLTAQSKDNNNKNSSSSSNNNNSNKNNYRSNSGSGGSNKKHSSLPHDRLNNHHHHPNIKARGS